MAKAFSLSIKGQSAYSLVAYSLKQNVAYSLSLSLILSACRVFSHTCRVFSHAVFTLATIPTYRMDSNECLLDIIPLEKGLGLGGAAPKAQASNQSYTLTLKAL